MGYNPGMKVKTSVTLSDELVGSIDHYGRDYRSRSDFIEAAVRAFIKQIVRDEQNARDLQEVLLTFFMCFGDLFAPPRSVCQGFYLGDIPRVRDASVNAKTRPRPRILHDCAILAPAGWVNPRPS